MTPQQMADWLEGELNIRASQGMREWQQQTSVVAEIAAHLRAQPAADEHAPLCDDCGQPLVCPAATAERVAGLVARLDEAAAVMALAKDTAAALWDLQLEPDCWCPSPGSSEGHTDACRQAQTVSRRIVEAAMFSASGPTPTGGRS